MHESPRTPCRYQLRVRIYACTTSTAFTLAPCWHQTRMHHINSLHFCSFASAFNNCKPTLPPLPFFFLSSHSHTTTHFLHYLLLRFFFPWLCILFTWRSLQKQNNRAQGSVAFQARKSAEALLSCLFDKHTKRAQLGTASQQMAFPGRELASVPGRDWQTCPGRALANVPRQGTGKASQAGTAKHKPRQGTGKRSQAGNWQAFPGRKLASVPRQGTGKRPRQGLQACPGSRGQCTLASVPRQGTGKRPRQGTASMPRQGMHTGKRSQAGNWQAFPGRELASVPRQGNWLQAIIPRQGTGKRSQAGNWKSVPGRDCKRAQAGHWQMFPGREP